MTVVDRSTKPPRASAISPRTRAMLTGVLGVIAVIAVWWISADTIFHNVGVSPTGQGGSIPTPLGVVQSVVADGWTFYSRNFAVTGTEALIGYAGGNAIALVIAAAVVLVPMIESTVLQVSVISYCIPIVAIGPIARIVIGVPASGDPSGTAMFLAALLVVFTTVIGALLGLRAADQAALDIVTVYGGGPWKQLVKVRLIAALPAVLNALKIAAPSAFLGAIIGEYLGGVDLGVGPALINAQQSLAVPRAWGLALVTGLVSCAGYGVVALTARYVTPWSRGI